MTNTVARRALVTGATGFVGTSLCRVLADRGYLVRGSTRGTVAAAQPKQGGVTFVTMGDLATGLDWRPALEGCDCVVHLAARVHRPLDGASQDPRQYQRLNRDATLRIAEQAAALQIRRFVLVSSAKVNGEDGSQGPVGEADNPRLRDAYAISKREAEHAVTRIGAQGRMECVVLRPPLVYGPGVKANFLALLRAIDKGWPLPFASIENRRSLIYVANLADAVARCIEAPAAAGKTYLVSDGTAVSTPGLCRALAAALGRPARLFRFPVPVLELAPPLRKLTRSFEVDDSAIRRDLGWTPPYTFEEGIRATAQWYLSEYRKLRG